MEKEQMIDEIWRAEKLARQNKVAVQFVVTEKKCRCREPKRDPYCMYCGHLYAGEFVCGVCHEQGIDGKVIRGTSRVICSLHKK